MRQGRAPRRRVFAAVVSGIALGNADIETCKPGDADGNNQITIDEILTVLAKALERCDAT